MALSSRLMAVHKCLLPPLEFFFNVFELQLDEHDPFFGSLADSGILNSNLFGVSPCFSCSLFGKESLDLSSLSKKRFKRLICHTH